jgi:hypothetical protein
MIVHNVRWGNTLHLYKKVWNHICLDLLVFSECIKFFNVSYQHNQSASVTLKCGELEYPIQFSRNDSLGSLASVRTLQKLKTSNLFNFETKLRNGAGTHKLLHDEEF